ncbi:hypothetical protein [Pseudaeromonas paramecii]
MSAMNIFDFWQRFDHRDENTHPDDEAVLAELQAAYSTDFDMTFPPGPYFGPLKTAKIVLCYANPSADQPSVKAVSKQNHHDTLLRQLSGEEDYPYQIGGWDTWFRRVANSLFAGDDKLASRTVAIANLIPYASKNMDNVEAIANCLPSVWAMQDHLRHNLIPRAKRGEILLVMCRSSHLWGLRTSHGSENIIINDVRSGYTTEIKKIVSKFLAMNNFNLTKSIKPQV